MPKHIHIFKPCQFFHFVTFQCYCGVYAGKKEEKGLLKKYKKFHQWDSEENSWGYKKKLGDERP